MSMKGRTLEGYKKTKRVRRERNLLFLRTLKSVPCTDCGIQFPHYVMEFDHCRGDKSCNLSTGRMSLTQISNELDKCDVVCANCHKTRTWNRLQSVESFEH